MLKSIEYKTIEWDREKLYEQIWKTPLRTVAKEYGLSDVGLAKICWKLRIPRPGVGYWRRKECGLKVSRPPLPAMAGRDKLISHIPVAPPPKPPEPGPPLPALRKSPITSIMHDLVRQTATAFENGHTNQFGRLRASNWQTPHLDLRVTPAGLDRALKFMDRLIRLLEANDMAVSVTAAREPVATNIEVDGEKIQVVLREYVHGRKRELNPSERRDRERAPEIYRQDFRLAYSGTNRFVFLIESYTDGQREWTDSKRQRIEECLEQIVHGVRRAAAYAKRLRAEREVEHRLREEQARLRMEEQARIERLKRNIDKWEEAEKIRCYVATVRRKAEGKEPLKANSPISRFLDWALRYADCIDPTDASAGPDWNDEDS